MKNYFCKKNITKFALIVALVLSISSLALAQGPFSNIKTIKTLPIYGMKMIETDSGIFFVSENGRFVFKGTMLDMWNGKPVRTVEDVDKIVNHIDLNKFLQSNCIIYFRNRWFCC